MNLTHTELTLWIQNFKNIKFIIFFFTFSHFYLMYDLDLIKYIYKIWLRKLSIKRLNYIRMSWYYKFLILISLVKKNWKKYKKKIKQ